MSSDLSVTFPDDPSEHAWISGTVKLRLRKRLALGRVSVQLLGEAVVRYRGRETKGLTLDVIHVVREPATYEAGESTVDFRLSVPQATAPYYFKGPLGSIYHTAVAHVEGAGPKGATLEAKDDFSVSAGPGRSGESDAAAMLDISVQDVIDDLGPVRLAWTSPRFTRASVFATDLVIAAPPVAVVLLDASLLLHETFTLRHYDAAGRPEPMTVTTDTRSAHLCRLDASSPPFDGGKRRPAGPPGPLAHLEAGQSYVLRHLQRLPHSQVITRNVTPHGVDTPIRAAQELELVVRFARADAPTHVRSLSIRRDVDVVSCLTLDSNLILPDYAEHDVSPVDAPAEKRPRAIDHDRWGSRKHEFCVCKLTFAECLDDFLRHTPPPTPATATASAPMPFKVV